MKTMTIAGTRPDLIKLSEIIKELDERTNHIFVHTGQNHDPGLHDVFFRDLGLRRPDYDLGVAAPSLGKMLSKLMQETENVLLAEKPDAVIILGDTNSALAGIVAKRLKIPFFHLEAGNRCFDDRVPEEVNRRLLDHIADVNLVFTEHARRNLLHEGLRADRIYKMGSPMLEVINQHRKAIDKNDILKRLKLKPKNYYVVSIHRDENTADEFSFRQIVDGINTLAHATKSLVIMPLHPRTQVKLEGHSIHKNIVTTTPFGFIDYAKLQSNAACVISDSGTLAEESALLGFRAVTVRPAIERPEAIDNGSMLIAPADPLAIMEAVSAARPADFIPLDYMKANCAQTVVNAVLSYTYPVKEQYR